MQRLIAALCGVVATASQAWAADVYKAPLSERFAAADPNAATLSQRWTATFATEVRYFSWTSNRGQPTSPNTSPGSGHQTYVPVALQLVGRPTNDWKVEFLARGGWVHSHQTTPSSTGTVDTVTDTVASSGITYLGWSGIQPFLSVSVNLPTGLASLSASQAFARMDGDLVEIGGFGEGTNIGPTAGFSIPVTPQFIVSASAGYTWRGAYNRERSISATAVSAVTPTDIDPGDVFTGTATISYGTEKFTSKITGSLSEETETVENGRPLYKPGRRYVVSGNWAYNWSETFGVTSLNASMSHSEKNEVLYLGAPALVKEVMNTNSNLYKVGVQHLVPMGQFAFGPTGSYLYRDKNGYNTQTLQFVPAKERWSAGLVARYAATDNVTFNVRVDRVWTHEDEKLAQGGLLFSVLANAFVAGSSVPVVSSDGWQVAGGANVTF